MNQKVIIIGASGHGKVVADIITACGDEVIGFLDDDPQKESLGCIDSFVKYPEADFFIAIGDTRTRKEISRRIHCNWYTAVHPSAVISPSVSIGPGTVIMPNCVINANATIGSHCIVNSASVVEHDNKIGNYSHVSVGAKLGGGVRIGEAVWVGIGATISNNISVCSNTIIGAGAVVVKNIDEPGIYIGMPARKKEG